MRAKMECGGRETSEMEREAKEPGLCSTRRRRVRSGRTQAGISLAGVGGKTVGGAVVEDLTAFCVPLPLGARGGVEVVAAGGDMVIVDGATSGRRDTRVAGGTKEVI